MPPPNSDTASRLGWLDDVFGRIRHRYEAVDFAKLAEDTKDGWESRGYRVHVNTNERRIVITPKEARRA